MIVNCLWEHNGGDTLLHALDHPGAYTRGENLETAISKMPSELSSYLRWCGEEIPQDFDIIIASEQPSQLAIRDADSDVLYDREKSPLPEEEYETLKELALKSARDFLSLYESIPDRDAFAAPPRTTFYGSVPRTAREMYEHTKNVNAYYFAEIDVPADNDGDILSCRRRGFAALERCPDYLQNPVFEGSYGEDWTLRKVLRRFLWHDRIHARAMYRMAASLFGRERIADPFFFSNPTTLQALRPVEAISTEIDGVILWQEPKKSN